MLSPRPPPFAAAAAADLLGLRCRSAEPLDDWNVSPRVSDLRIVPHCFQVEGIRSCDLPIRMAVPLGSVHQPRRECRLQAWHLKCCGRCRGFSLVTFGRRHFAEVRGSLVVLLVISDEIFNVAAFPVDAVVLL